MVVVVILLGTLILVAFVLAPAREIRTEVEIDAPPDRVWRVLADGARYGEWNPFIVSMRGLLTPGATLENRIRPRGRREMTFRPTVLVATPDEELRWLGRLLVPRLFDGEHYFLLEPIDRGTRLVHGERFRGLALWLIDVRSFLADFEAMNAALRARAESSL